MRRIGEECWLGAGARALGILSTIAPIPGLAGLTRLVTARPHVCDELVAGVPTTVVRPGRGRRWPAIVVVGGVTARGRHHPYVQRLALALGRVGFLVYVPDPPGLARGEIAEETVEGTVAVARFASEQVASRGARTALVGVCNGGTLALLAAEDPSLAGRVSVVAAIAPYTDIVNATRLATTGVHAERGRLVPYPSDPFLGLVIARSLVAALPESDDRASLMAALRRLPDDAPEPLSAFRALRLEEVDPSARALVSLLANRDPGRFDTLCDSLSPELRARIARLSPLCGAERLQAPVEVASAPRDKYFPLEETRALARAAPRNSVRLTTTTTLDHAIPNLSCREIAGLLRFHGWLVRSLRLASRT